MAITDPVAEGFARAAECDVVVVLPKEDEPYPYWEGIAVLPTITACNAMLARCRIHLNDDRDELAWRELSNYLTTWSKFTQPLFLVDLMIDLGVWQYGVEFATEQLETGRMPLETAKELAELRFDAVGRLERAIEGEAVWLAASAMQAEWALMEPRWFGWIRRDIPPSEGLFKEEDDFGSLRSAYFGPGNVATQIAIALETAVAQVRFLQGDDAWDPTWVPKAEYGDFTIAPSGLFARREVIALDSMLRFELRILEKEHGSLVENKDAVESLVARYPGVVHDWDGDDLLLDVSPDWQRDTAIAREKDPDSNSEISELVETLSERHASDEDLDWPVRLTPLGE